MSANSIVLWTAALFVGLAAGMMLVPPPPPVTSLEAGLGPVVATDPL